MSSLNVSPAVSSAGLTPASSSSGTPAKGPDISNFKLANGMDVIVIPDHRAPVITHMVWYRNGAADDPVTKSGIAHFLEHLMFKGTKLHAKGEFSEVIAELGGQENAFTSYDYTAYYQRTPKEHLAVMMDFEADRMTNLVLTDEIVAPERDVVLEERRMRTDNDPSQQLSEAVQAALFTHHPYGKPVIGWEHEISSLNRDDAIAYYQRFYTPENAVLIVAGDVEAAEVRTLADATYGKIPARGEPPKRVRPQEPPARAHRLVSLSDEKVEQPSTQRVYLVPSYASAKPGEAEALEILGHLMGGGQTSLLYKKLVVDDKIAVAAGAYYWGQALDETRFFVYGVPAPGISLEELDAALCAVVADVAKNGVLDDDLVRTKTRLIADAVYAQDSQASLARWYGSALTTGVTIKDVQEWPDRIDVVTAEQVRQAAADWLHSQRSVTGFLLPAQDSETEAEAA